MVMSLSATTGRHTPICHLKSSLSLRISTQLKPYPEYKELRMSQGELDSVYKCLDIQENGLLKIALCLHGFIVVLFMILWLSKSHSSKDVTY